MQKFFGVKMGMNTDADVLFVDFKYIFSGQFVTFLCQLFHVIFKFCVFGLSDLQSEKV